MTASPPPAGLTAKGEATRARILASAVDLLAERGLTETTIADVKARSGVSSSQLYHYFADKDALVHAVIARQAQVILAGQDRAGIDTAEGLRAWRDGVVDQARTVAGAGGCPLGHLVGQLAESDEAARVELADGFERWAEAMRVDVRRLHAAGGLRAEIDPDDYADTLLATLQGGLLLAQVSRDPTALATALDTLLSVGLAE